MVPVNAHFKPLATVHAGVTLVHATRAAPECVVTLALEGKAKSKRFKFRVDKWSARAFVSYPDTLHGFVLVVSEPAAGLMSKALYASDLTGAHWHKVAQIDRQIPSCYPDGISFMSPTVGWITATYHGAAPIPLYHTVDGGKHWALEKLPLPHAFAGGYGNTADFAPFSRTTMTCRVEFVKQGRRYKTTMATSNGGRTWFDGGPSYRISSGMRMMPLIPPRMLRR